jgi:hypothetical protein
LDRPRKQRRNSHGSAWHGKQTDCWYHTPRGTKRREPLLDDQGKRIRGPENKRAAQLALVRVRLKQGLAPITEIATSQPKAGDRWLVAGVCSECLVHSERAVAAGRMHPERRKGVIRYLNEWCRYRGVSDLTAPPAAEPTDDKTAAGHRNGP